MPEVSMTRRQYILVCLGIYLLAQNEATRAEALTFFKELTFRGEYYLKGETD